MAKDTGSAGQANIAHTEAVASLRAAQQQAKAAVEANGLTRETNSIANQTLYVAGAQAVLTLAATLYLIVSYLHSRSALRHSERALEEQRKNFRTETRAYVHANRATITQLEVGKPILVEFFIRNSGQTPSIQTQAQATLQIGHTDDDIPRVELVPTQSKAILGSQDERSVVASSYIPLTQQDLDALKVVERYVLISIGIAYEDIAGERHETTNAFRGVDGIASAPGKMQVRPRGNTMN